LFGYVATGLTLGLAAGLSPGPLLAFLVTQTLRYGVREGLLVALAPVLTDAPIVAASLLVLSRVAGRESLLAVISLAGGCYVIWQGIESLRPRRVVVGEGAASPHSIRKALAINLLNPHVYLFWATVGAPTVLRAARDGWAPAVGFVAGFYLLLCGSKAVLALLVHRSRKFMQGTVYRRTVQALGLALTGFGIWLAGEGLSYIIGGGGSS